MTRLLIGSVALAVVVASSVALFATYGGHLDLVTVRNGALRLVDYRRSHPLLAVGVYFSLYALISVAAFFPAAIALNLMAGAVFGVVGGSLLVAGASASAATLIFSLVRYAFRDAFLARYGPELGRFNAALARDGALFVWLVRVTPVFPFAVVNIVMGLTTVRLLTFFLVSTLGMLPASAAYAFVGLRLSQITTLADLLSWPVTLAFFVLGALPLATKSLLMRRHPQRQ